ncbi:ATP-binding protein [Acinetobacter sp. YH12105]|uniref:ATP-binding protein n=1 Tax=Acinetobacter sp. YH12105 TaxID=2601093 RepID=UPI0015D19674|nr:ATP-binding protein [Acinetobacter sp. YH12105]
MKLPSRYEDLEESYRGRLLPNAILNTKIKNAIKSMSISGGIRFLVAYGESGAGKSSSTIELKTHLPEVHTFLLTDEEIRDKTLLLNRVLSEHKLHQNKTLIPIIDQFEENVAGKENIPTQFVEFISLFDRNELKKIPTIFIWLTTSKDFQASLVTATSRNRRILLDENFEIIGPEKGQWLSIIKDNFSIHNQEKTLSDYLIIDSDIESIIFPNVTLGSTIEQVGDLLAEHIDDIQDLSEYTVILLWPVADSIRNQRVLQFSRPRDAYLLDWEAFYRELSAEEKRQLPLDVYNRTRLYFDMRIIPVRVADLHKLCINLNDDTITLGKTYLDRFSKTHFFHVVNETWNTYDYAPVRERESERSTEAATWYTTVTSQPTLLGKRLAKILTTLELDANHEHEIKTEFSTVRSDVFIDIKDDSEKKYILELKVYSSANTMPSTIKEQIKVTLRRHALLAGFMKKN